MLEILLLVVMSKKLGRGVEAKGHKKFPYQLLLWVLWFGGEIGGAVLGGVTASVRADGDEAPMFLVYLCALGGAAVGAIIAHAIAYNLRPVEGFELREPDLPEDTGRLFGERNQRRDEVTDRPSPRTDDHYS